MKAPNILVCGTPGTGKTQLSSTLAEEEPSLEHVDLSKLVKDTPSLRESFDQESDAWILNEDAIVDYLEEKMSHGGIIIDTHSLIDYFPERWFDLVLVLETTNTLLYDRLKGRGYSEAKVQENVQCEIFGVVRDEAMDSYAAEIVQVLPSNTIADLESNVERVKHWLRARGEQDEDDM